MADIFSDPQYDFWENDSEELNDEDVIIEQDQYASYEDDDEELDNQFFNDTIMNDEDELENSIKDDPYLSSWIPTKTVSNNSFSGIFKNEGARTGQPTNLNSSAVGRGQMIKGTRLAMYKKLGIGDVDKAEQQFRSNPEFEMQVMNAYKDDLDKRIPSNVQGKQREYMIAKGWYTGDPFYKDDVVPGKSAGNKLTAGEYARRATMQYGGVNNIPKDLLDGISQESLQEYYEENNAPTLEFDENINEQQNWGNGVANVIQGVGKGIEKVKDWRDKFNEYTNNITKTTSNLIDFTTEQAGIQQNQLSLRKFNAQKNSKKYQLNTKSRNSPLIYT